MRKLNQYIFKRRAVKHLQQNKRLRQWVSYDKAKTILLLFESDYIEKNRFIRDTIEAFHKEGKKVSAWGFLNKKTTNTAILPSFKILDKSSIDRFGRPKESFLRELSENKFDLLIDLTQQDILPLQYVSLYANADCKTGMSRTMNESIIDFKIVVPAPEKEEFSEKTAQKKGAIEIKNRNEVILPARQQFLFDQIVHYLKSIRSKD